MRIIPLILSGGAGTRLWPASREARPKQFLTLFGERSSFQDTLLRVSDPALFGKPVIMTNRDHRFLVAEQLDEIGREADIVLEPVRRDSGPAIAAGAHFIAQRDDEEALVLVLAADHVVTRPDAFLQACRMAAETAASGGIVLFGIRPDHPATGYGYVKPAIHCGEPQPVPIHSFVEKPALDVATAYVESGYLWNSGNFLFRADTAIAEYARLDSETEAHVRHSVEHAKNDLQFLVLDEAAFSRATALSFDYAIMEKTDKAFILAADIGWSDIGSWQEVWSLSPKDENGNVIRGSGHALDANANLIISDRLMTVAVGVDDLAIITTEDAVLVGRKSDSAALKSMVGRLRETHPHVTENGARVYRPWGSYQSLDNGTHYQVKRIVVKPGGLLSLQKHKHRSEHWVVVTGTARIVIGDEIRILNQNESVYIPMGTLHRLENPGTTDLELIEVQTGSYLGEDDIVRVEDAYNRMT